MTAKTEPNPNETGAKQLAQWRENMGYSQRDAVDQLGCSREAFGGWERGEQKTPRYILLACKALALGIKAEDPQPQA